jgi:hypothetical protein
MSADAYLYGILAREAVDTGPNSPVLSVLGALQPFIQRWAGDKLLSVNPSGSYAKGTPNRSGTDIDLFISLSPQTNETLSQIYEALFAYLSANGFNPKRQNVSINVRVSGAYDVDLVPAKRQNMMNLDHSLYRRRVDTWTKTNVQTHINHVRAGGRQSEIRILKLWRTQKGLDLPSFYIELTAIDALRGYTGTLSQNVFRVFRYMSESFVGARVVDPANTNNVISDDLTAAEKNQVKSAADRALRAENWNEIVR